MIMGGGWSGSHLLLDADTGVSQGTRARAFNLACGLHRCGLCIMNTLPPAIAWLNTCVSLEQSACRKLRADHSGAAPVEWCS